MKHSVLRASRSSVGWDLGLCRPRERSSRAWSHIKPTNPINLSARTAEAYRTDPNTKALILFPTKAREWPPGWGGWGGGGGGKLKKPKP